MSTPFDPYYKWLGISPADQPPDHYRLLGLERLESDPEVIDNAADQRSAHVRTYQSGRHSDQSQRLLNEIAAARVCLLDPIAKQAYDAKLDIQDVSAGPLITPRTQLGDTSETVAISVSKVRPATHRSRRRPVPVLVQTIGGGMAGIILAWFILHYGFGIEPFGGKGLDGKLSDSIETPAVTLGLGDLEPQSLSALAPLENPRLEPDIQQDGVIQIAPSSRWEGSREIEDLTGDADAIVAANNTEDDNTALEVDGEKATIGVVIRPNTRQDEEDVHDSDRVPLPQPNELQRAAQIVSEIYRSQYEQVRTDGDRIALAEALLGDAQESSEDLAGKYALLYAARTIAIEAGKIDLALAAVEQISATFDVQDLALRSSTAIEAANRAQATEEHHAAFLALLMLTGEAVKADAYDAALPLASAARDSSRKARNAELRAHAETTFHETERLRDEYAKVKPLIERLDSPPLDPTANEQIGRYYAFEKGDWANGLSYLAQGTTASIRRLAELELSDKPDPLALGDGWWVFSDELSGHSMQEVKQHAESWYRKALPTLLGLARSKVESRLREVGANDPSSAESREARTPESTPKVVSQTSIVVSAKTSIGASELNPKAYSGIPVIKGQLIALTMSGQWRWGPKSDQVGQHFMRVVIGDPNARAIHQDWVDAEMEIVAPASGFLYFGIRDGNVADNKGSIKIVVTVYDTQATVPGNGLSDG